MSLPRYLLAKYVPDPFRMEPRNIGVIVWADGWLGARFLGENGSDRARLKPPSRIGVSDPKLYDRWVRHWRRLLEKPSLQGRNGVTVSRDQPQFLDVLVSKSRLAFMLVDGGVVQSDVPPSELPDLTADLFETLVLEEGDLAEEHPASETRLLNRACQAVFAESGLRDRPDFREAYTGLPLIKGVARPFVFDFALHPRFGAGGLETVLQRVLLRRQTSVASAAFIFDCLTGENGLPKEHCVALVYATPPDEDDEQVKNSLELMGGLGNVLNVYDTAAAVRQLVALAG